MNHLLFPTRNFSIINIRFSRVLERRFNNSFQFLIILQRSCYKAFFPSTGIWKALSVPLKWYFDSILYNIESHGMRETSNYAFFCTKAYKQNWTFCLKRNSFVGIENIKFSRKENLYKTWPLIFQVEDCNNEYLAFWCLYQFYFILNNK